MLDILLVDHTPKKRIVMVAVIFIIFNLVGYMANGSEYFGLYLFCILGLFAGVLFLVIDKQRDKIEMRIIAAETEIKSALEVYQRTHLKNPLNLEGWSISAHFLNRMIEEIHKIKPKFILECGSGVSSLVIADCLRQIGGGFLISLEHEDKYAEITAMRLKDEDLESYATIIPSPLKYYKLEKETYLWYDFELEEHVLEKIDMLIVDGPPGKKESMSRYLAVPLLEKHLADKCTIMLDDTNRSDERKIAELWADYLNASLIVNEHHRGYALLKTGLQE